MFRKPKPQVVVEPRVARMFEYFRVDTSFPRFLLERHRFSHADIGNFVIRFVAEQTPRIRAAHGGWFDRQKPLEVNIVSGDLRSLVYQPEEENTFEEVITHEIAHAIHFRQRPHDFLRKDIDLELFAYDFEEKYAPAEGAIVNYCFLPEYDPIPLISVYDGAADFYAPYDWAAS